MTPQALKISESIELPNSPHADDDARPLIFRIVANDVARRAETIQRELEAAFEPATPVQTAAVAELALARTRQYDLESAYDALVAESRTHAADAADRFARDRFVRDRESWLADPALNLPILAATLKGTEMLARIWEDFAASLTPGTPGPTDELKRLAAAALGSPWQVDKVRGDGAWLLSRLIRIAKDPGFEAAHWAKLSDSPDSTSERARWIGSLAPEPATARAELVERANAEYARWSQVAEFCRQRESRAADEHAGPPAVPIAVDANLDKRIRQTSRELAAARNRADRLERRLDSLMKPRRNSRAQPSAAESATTRIMPASKPQIPDLAPSMPNPAYEDTTTDSCSRDTRISAILCVPERTPTAEPLAKDAGREPAAPIVALQASNPGEIGETEVHESTSRDTEESAATDAADDLEAMARTIACLKTRLKQFRFLNWRDPNAIAQCDVDILTRIRRLPRSAERDKLIRQVFGSEKTFERAWRGYRSWNDRQAPGFVLTVPVP